MSGAVKNLFGCIPGLRKPEMHCLKPNIDSFCDMLIDLSLAVKPTLSVMDAVDCMLAIKRSIRVSIGTL